MNLSPAQRKMLYIGVPVVAVLGLYMYLRSRSSSSSATTAATAAPSGTTTASNTPIGLDQLTSYETQVTAQLAQLGQAVQAVQAAQTASPTSPSTSTGYTPSPFQGSPATVTAPTSSGVTQPTSLPTIGAPPGSVSVGGATYDYIQTPAAGSVLSAAGDTIYAIEGSTPVAVVQGGKRTAAWNYLPAGTKLYDQAPA